MTVIEVKNPSEYELDVLLEEASEDSDWLIRERIPYVGEPEFNEHVVDNVWEASRIIRAIGSPRVASEVVYVEVGDELLEDNLLFDAEGERAVLNVSEETRRAIEEEKPDDMEFDEFLRNRFEDSAHN